MQLTDSGGIFTGADVSYRGVSVGRVGSLQLTGQGVEAQLEIRLEIRPDAPPIPADLDAAVTNLSVIGEQFVDLRPRRSDGPTLAAGSVIPASRVSTPVPVADLIANLDTFVRSVPLDSLRTVVDELGTGFTGTGRQLQTLLDSTDALTRRAIAALPLSVYPVVTAATDSSVVPDDGFAHLGLVLGEFDPYTCERGYQGTIRRTGTDTTPVPANRNALCAEPPGSPTDVRGAQNVPRAGVPGEVAPGGSGRPARSAVAAGRPSSSPITSLTSILEG